MNTPSTNAAHYPRRRNTLALVLTLCCCLGSGLLRLTPATAAEATQPYAVVEVGAKGVKGYLFDLDHAAKDPACSKDNDAYMKCIDAKTLPQINCNHIDDAPLFKVTVNAVKQFTDGFAAKGIPAKHVYIVGSSSLAEGLQHNLLATQLGQLSPANPVGFVNVEQEATFGFKGVLGLLPGKWRAIRAPEATTIDIGSGNTKGAYQNTGGSMVYFGLDAGTKVAAEAITAAQKSDTFRAAADNWRTTVFVPKLRTEIETKQGIAGRNRVYLIGGAVWALATLTHPDDTTSKFPRIDPKSIDALLDRASAPGAEGDLYSDAQKRKYPEVAKVAETFSVKQLVGGLEILKALSEELGFASNNKNVFFFRDSLFAWPLGYISDKLSVPRPN